VRSQWSSGGWQHGVWAVALVLAACGDDRQATDTTSAPRAATRADAPAGAAGTITLITGDRITLRQVAGGVGKRAASAE